MLQVENLKAFYGRAQALHDVSLEVDKGEVVALLGRNGAGKTTTLKAIMGLLRQRSGRIEYAGIDAMTLQPYQLAKQGLGYVPEHRGVFHKLTVEQNLQVAGSRTGGMSIDAIYEMFPHLLNRRRNFGNQLSGGEQQMLAIARALLLGPRLVLLDEPSQGLAPVVVKDVLRAIRLMQERGISILMVEQRLSLCQAVADRFYIIDSGTTVHSGSGADLSSDDDAVDRYLVLGGRH